MTTEPRESVTDCTRRSAVAAMAVGTIGAGRTREAAVEQPKPKSRPRIAAVVTEYRKGSHGQGIIDRLMDGYGWQGGWHHPAVDVVSMYVDQRPKGDLTDERLARHPGLKVYPTIAEALTRGTDSLAVDGVMLIGEHGTYPRDAKGHRLYPRYPFFQQIVEVYRKTGKTAPVFNDKHLSWNWEWCRSMVDQARELDFPFLAGSSLPITWRIPEVEAPLDAKIEEGVCIGYGGVDSYDFHGLESLQCMVERRKGGETGVSAVEAFRGDAVWKFLAEKSDGSKTRTRELFDACLCRSFRLSSPLPGYGNAFPDTSQLPALVRDPILYRITYNDGLIGNLFMMSGLVYDFTVAIRLEGGSTLSTQLNLPGLAPGQTLPNFFSPLAYYCESMFLTGKTPYPVERTLLTSGVLCTAVDLLASGQTRLDTPHLRTIAYQPPRESQFMRS
ncbi:hypothetical protein [Paludisphaera borealis]|uniref:Uncharacterized protein n=1 Tax=Paludisphaera borealis TaxID=1387353 RepID=A0A1U7CL60_9BACT|nr:hypothetical protein [Paludisphaera borealis]APW59672.1 hypothetical protein BSF38_01101 [Paludisphaera borealis]